MSRQNVLQSLKDCRGVDYEHASSMPADYYVSEEFLQLEIEQLFYRQWICLGRQEEIPDSGDYFVAELINESVLIVRDKQQQIRAYANVCRHRGTPVASGRGNTRHFVCPYHAWTYDTSGKLLQTPHVKRDECSGEGLAEFRCEIWSGFIYVNLDSNAQDLAPQLTGLEQLVHNYHMEEMSLRYSSEGLWNTNWKCLAENFMEGYHLSHVHRTSLHPITPTHLCEHFEPGPAYLGFMSGYPADLPVRGNSHSDVTDQQRKRSVMFSVLPAHVVGLGSHAMFFLQLQPRGVNKVHARLGISIFDDDLPAAEVDQMSEFFEHVMLEDKVQLEALFKGLSSRFHKPGVLAPRDYEGTVLDYYRYMDTLLNTSSANKMASSE